MERYHKPLVVPVLLYDQKVPTGTKIAVFIKIHHENRDQFFVYGPKIGLKCHYFVKTTAEIKQSSVKVSKRIFLR